MKRLTVLLAVFAGLLLSSIPAAEASPILYASAGSTLYTLDTTTGAVSSTIGPIGYEVTGLAFHPTTGVLYGATSVTSSSDPRSLITINTTTGAGTLVGSHGGDVMTDLAFNSAGTLYGWSGWRDRGTSDLNTINLSTGIATIVGDFGQDTSGNGIAFDASGTLFADLRFPAAGYLHTIDPTTGLSTGTLAKVGPFSSGQFFNALEYDPTTGLLFGMSRQLPLWALFTIDPTTGVMTQLGPEQFTFQFDAIAFQTAAVPEPTSLALLAVGAMGVVVHRRRKQQA